MAYRSGQNSPDVFHNKETRPRLPDNSKKLSEERTPRVAHGAASSGCAERLAGRSGCDYCRLPNFQIRCREYLFRRSFFDPFLYDRHLWSIQADCLDSILVAFHSNPKFEADLLQT